MSSASATGIAMAALLFLCGCATRPIAPVAGEPATASPAGCPRSPVALEVLGEDDELRLWHLGQLTRRNVAVDPSARMTVQVEAPVVEDRGDEACLVLAARMLCDGQEFSGHVVEATRCYPGTASKGARAFLALAGLAAGLATGREPEFPPDPETAPIETMRAELVERIARASR